VIFGVHFRRSGDGFALGAAIGYEPSRPREAGLEFVFWRWTVLIGFADADWSSP
jgi:hypothetical protein